MVISREMIWLEFSFPKSTLAVKRRMDLLRGELGKYQDSRSGIFGGEWGEGWAGVQEW